MLALQQQTQVSMEKAGDHDRRCRADHDAMFGRVAMAVRQFPAREIDQPMFFVETSACQRAARYDCRLDQSRRMQSYTHNFPQPSYRRRDYDNYMTLLQRQVVREKIVSLFETSVSPHNSKLQQPARVE